MIAQLVAASELAKELKEPASMISAFKNVAQICGYYRQEEVRPAKLTGDQVAAQANFAMMSDAQLLALIEAGQVA